MATTLNWATSADGGYMYADELSDVLRTAMQPLTRFRGLCEPDPDAVSKGLHRGDKHRWNVYGDVSAQGRRLGELSPMPETNFTTTQAELTVYEFGNSVPYSGKLTAMAKHDVLKIIHQALKHDARKAMDIEVFEQLDTCKVRVAPTGGTSTTSITVTENASTATTNNVALGTG